MILDNTLSFLSLNFLIWKMGAILPIVLELFRVWNELMGRLVGCEESQLQPLLPLSPLQFTGPQGEDLLFWVLKQNRTSRNPVIIYTAVAKVLHSLATSSWPWGTFAGHYVTSFPWLSLTTRSLPPGRRQPVLDIPRYPSIPCSTQAPSPLAHFLHFTSQYVHCKTAPWSENPLTLSLTFQTLAQKPQKSNWGWGNSPIESKKELWWCRTCTGPRAWSHLPLRLQLPLGGKWFHSMRLPLVQIKVFSSYLWE